VSDMAYNEKLLVESAQRGDTDAQKAIYRLHIRYLTAVCSRYVVNQEDVKDIMQDAFIKIFSSLSFFEYRGDGSLKGWMYRIVLNKTMRFMQLNGRIKFADISEADESVAISEPEMESIPADVIYDLIRKLPDGYRTIFNLYVIEGKSHKEIAAMIDIKVNTSASQLHRAKAMLAAKIRHYQSTSEILSI